jgi:hypothetical protein
VAGRPWPVASGPNYASPIHQDDLIEQVTPLLDVASVPATIVNWAGEDAASEREMLEYISQLTGLEARVAESDTSFKLFVSDNSRRRALIGDCQVSWREGVRRALEVRFPDLELL